LKPSAERDEMREIGIAQAGELAFDVSLGGGEGFFKFGEILGLGVIKKGGGVLFNSLTCAESLGISGNVGGDLGDIIRIARLNGNEAVGNEGTEAKGETGSIQRKAIMIFEMVGGVGKRGDFLEFIENLRNRGDGELVESAFRAEMLIIEEIFGDFRFVLSRSKADEKTHEQRGA